MDDLKSTQDPKDQINQPVSGQKNAPQPTPPEPAPTVPPTIEPKTLPKPLSQATPIQTTTIADKPSGKKIPPAITIGGALVILIMAATLPATIILVQNRTTIAPKAEEPVERSRPPHPETGKVFKVLSPEQQESGITGPMKPQYLKTEILSPESVKITFNTSGSFLSSIVYSPDEDWNYLNMFELGDIADEWKERYNPENQETVYPIGGKEIAMTDHEFVLENLIPDHKYYFAIRIEKPEEETVYEFGFEQPEGHFIFITE